MVVTGVAKYEGSKAGTLEGMLQVVSCPSCHAFMSVCNESHEVCSMAQAVCHADGSVRRDFEGLQQESAQGNVKASSDGFLLIEMVELPEQPEHRTKDAGISLVEALPQWLVDRSSLCVLQTAPASGLPFTTASTVTATWEGIMMTRMICMMIMMILSR